MAAQRSTGEKSRGGSGHRSIRALAIVSVAALAAVTLLDSAGVASPTATTSAVQTQSARAGILQPSGQVNGLSPAAQSKPSAADVARARAESQRRPMAGPVRATAKVTSVSPTVTSKSITAPVPNAVGDLQIFRNTTVPTSGVTSSVSEPSTDQSGKNIFQTSNWTSQFSHNNGATWTSLNPLTIFGAGFCCDQVTVHDPGRNLQLWLLQYGDHLTLATSSADNMSTWCPYTLTPQNLLGRPAGEVFDYNDLAVGTKNLYLTSNVFSAAGSFTGTAMVRLDLDGLGVCGAAPFAQVFRTDLFTLKVAQGSTDVAYAASTNLDIGTGSTLRMLSWPENSGVVTTINRPIAPFNYMSPNSGQNCGSPDGVVNNWCQRTDSRILGAARGNGLVRFSFNANQLGVGTARPFPYSRVETLRESDLALIANQDVYSGVGAHMYLSMAPDRRGHIGYIDTFGGGTGTIHYFPGAMVGIVDDFAPNFPGSYNFFLFGAGGGCLNSDGLRRWGDYNTARGGYTGAGQWTATSWTRTTNTNVGCGTATPISMRNVVFGRSRDLASYTRFYPL